MLCNFVWAEEVSPGVILDFNADNQVVGVEILMVGYAQRSRGRAPARY
jgi:hypothetical protein